MAQGRKQAPLILLDRMQLALRDYEDYLFFPEKKMSSVSVKNQTSSIRSQLVHALVKSAFQQDLKTVLNVLQQPLQSGRIHRIQDELNVNTALQPQWLQWRKTQSLPALLELQTVIDTGIDSFIQQDLNMAIKVAEKRTDTALLRQQKQARSQAARQEFWQNMQGLPSSAASGLKNRTIESIHRMPEKLEHASEVTLDGLKTAAPYVKTGLQYTGIGVFGVVAAVPAAVGYGAYKSGQYAYQHTGPALRKAGVHMHHSSQNFYQGIKNNFTVAQEQRHLKSLEKRAWKELSNDQLLLVLQGSGRHSTQVGSKHISLQPSKATTILITRLEKGRLSIEALSALLQKEQVHQRPILLRKWQEHLGLQLQAKQLEVRQNTLKFLASLVEQLVSARIPNQLDLIPLILTPLLKHQNPKQQWQTLQRVILGSHVPNLHSSKAQVAFQEAITDFLERRAVEPLWALLSLLMFGQASVRPQDYTTLDCLVRCYSLRAKTEEAAFENLKELACHSLLPHAMQARPLKAALEQMSSPSLLTHLQESSAFGAALRDFMQEFPLEVRPVLKRARSKSPQAAVAQHWQKLAGDDRFSKELQRYFWLEAVQLGNVQAKHGICAQSLIDYITTHQDQNSGIDLSSTRRLLNSIANDDDVLGSWQAKGIERVRLLYGDEGIRRILQGITHNYLSVEQLVTCAQITSITQMMGASVVDFAFKKAIALEPSQAIIKLDKLLKIDKPTANTILSMLHSTPVDKLGTLLDELLISSQRSQPNGQSNGKAHPYSFEIYQHIVSCYLTKGTQQMLPFARVKPLLDDARLGVNIRQEALFHSIVALSAKELAAALEGEAGPKYRHQVEKALSDVSGTFGKTTLPQTQQDLFGMFESAPVETQSDYQRVPAKVWRNHAQKTQYTPMVRSQFLSWAIGAAKAQGAFTCFTQDELKEAIDAQTLRQKYLLAAQTLLNKKIDTRCLIREWQASSLDFLQQYYGKEVVQRIQQSLASEPYSAAELLGFVRDARLQAVHESAAKQGLKIINNWPVLKRLQQFDLMTTQASVPRVRSLALFNMLHNCDPAMMLRMLKGAPLVVQNQVLHYSGLDCLQHLSYEEMTNVVINRIHYQTHPSIVNELYELFQERLGPNRVTRANVEKMHHLRQCYAGHLRTVVKNNISVWHDDQLGFHKDLKRIAQAHFAKV